MTASRAVARTISGSDLSKVLGGLASKIAVGVSEPISHRPSILLGDKDSDDFTQSLNWLVQASRS